MFTLKRKPLSMPIARPGAALVATKPIPTAATHFVSGAALKGPYPARRGEGACSGSAASGAPSGSSGRCPASTSPRSAMPAGSRRTRPMRRSARAGPGITRRCSSCSIPKQVSYDAAAQGCSSRATTRPRACARATMSARNTARASMCYSEAAARSGRGVARRAYDKALKANGLGPITTEILPAPAVLFRRGLSPAISRQEPARLLRARRHRRVLPDRHRSGERRLTVNCG